MIDSLVKYFFLSMPFTPLWGYILRGNFGMKVAVMTIYGNLSLLLFIILLVNKGRKNIIFPKYLIPIILLAIYYSIWDFYNGNVDENGIAIIFFRNYHVFTVTTILLIVNSRFSDKFIGKLIFYLKLTIVPAVIVSIIQAKYNQLFLTPESYLLENLEFLFNPYQMRPPSIFGYLDFNDIGLSFVPILSIIVAYSILIEKKKVGSIILIFLGGLSCVLSNGRYIMLGYLIILSQTMIGYKLRLKKVIAFAFSYGLSVFVLLLVLTHLIGYDLKAYYEERIMSESAATRVLAVSFFLKHFPQHPILGVGVRVNDELREEIRFITSQIHVGYLSVFYEYGLVGGILTLIFMYQIIVGFYQNAKETHFWGSFFGFLSFLFANTALVQYYIYFYGLIMLFIFDSYFMQKNEDESGAELDLRVH
jgi:hypothetical protein